MILRRFDPLSCSLIRVHASMNMSACALFNEQLRQRIKSPEYHHMICIGKTKCTSEKGLLMVKQPWSESLKRVQVCVIEKSNNCALAHYSCKNTAEM